MKYFCLILCILFMAALFFTKNYKKDWFQKINKKENTLSFLYPVAAYILDKIKYFQREGTQKKKKEFASLFPRDEAERKFVCYCYLKLSWMLLIVGMTSVLCLLVLCKEGGSQAIKKSIVRPEYGQGSRYLDLVVHFKEGKHELEENMEIEVKPREYTVEEIQEKMDAARSILQRKLLGSNQNVNSVSNNLNLSEKYENTPICISWSSEPKGYINEDGSLNNKSLKHPVSVNLRALLFYEQMEKEYVFTLCISPYSWRWDEKVKYDFLQAQSSQNEERKSEKDFLLPERLGKTSLTYQINQKSKAGEIFVLGLVVSALVYAVYEEKIKQARKERERQMFLDYPELVSKLTLLIGSGMTVKRAWEKMILEYERVQKKDKRSIRYAYEEMILTWNEMENGISEVMAFERFGRRIKLKVYLRLVSLLTQNMKKGSKGMLELLSMEAREAMEERKQTARKLGEEAGTKLLIPMILMLGIVLVIVMVPAFLSMS